MHQNDSLHTPFPNTTLNVPEIHRVFPLKNPNIVPMSSPLSSTLYSGDEMSMTEITSVPQRPSLDDTYTVVSNGVTAVASDQGGETWRVVSVNMPRLSDGSIGEFRQKIENASPATARYVAMRMYESMKSHGMRDEVGRAFNREGENNEVNDDGGVRKKSEDLMGMEYLLKDGFVSFLRDVAKITPPIPQQVVRFSDITYSKRFEISNKGYETFGNKVMNFFIGPFKTLFQDKKSTWLQILKGVDGYIMPGSLTLLLGPPGCGKSTLLEILAGQVEQNMNTNMQGVVLYNDKYASEIRLSRLIAYISGQVNKHIPFLSVRETLEFARDCTQGLRPENFTPRMRKFFAHALVEGQDPLLEYVLEILGLKNIENKLTGEAISDTDRQKLTAAELALGTYSVMLYDQPFSGSDLATTYDLVDVIRTISRIQQSSAILALTQVSQEVFDLFDRIILLGDGHVLYQGPRQDAIPYFSRLGYEKPSYVESAEFLEDIVGGYGSQYATTESIPLTVDEFVQCYRASDHYRDIKRVVKEHDVKHTYWVESEPGLGLSLKTPSKYHCIVDAEPRKETELVVAKLSTKLGHSGGIESTGRVQIGDVITAISINNEETEYLSVGPQTVQRERASHAYSMLKKSQGHNRLQVERYKEEEDEYPSQWEQFQRPFVQTWWTSTKSLIIRQIKITKRLSLLLKLRLFQVTTNVPVLEVSNAILLGIFSGTLFYKLGGQYNQQQMNSVRALGFISTMSIMLINMVQLPLYLLQRPTFYKHRSQRFFRASSYTVAQCVVNLPQTFIEALVYALCIYFLAGLSLAGNWAVFLEFLLLLFLVAYFGSSVFFLLSAISPIAEVGNALAGLLVSILLLFSGFVIYPSNIPIYWKWLIYANPIHWANVSFCRFQFETYTEPCSKYLGQLNFCDQFPSVTVGKAYLIFNELSTDAKRPWLPYTILLGSIVGANLLALLGLKKVEFTGINQSLPHLKKNSGMSNFREDTESAFQSASSVTESSDDCASRYTGSQRSAPRVRNMRENGGVEKWIEDFRVDLESDGLGLPVEPMILVFEDLSFIRFDEEMKEQISVFNHITGYTRPKNMLAIIGASKTSKATALKCLAGRVPFSANLSGNLEANGAKPGPTFFRLTGYVEKLDAHQPYLTVRESLQFSAALRLSREINSTSRRIHVELVLNQLGLMLYSNQLVGGLRDSTGKTFEIAKRMTIAVELAANPSILFLEEPVYGLDITGTLNILHILCQLSASGRTIIATLTHPTSRSLSFFNYALILTREGQQAYFGPVGPNCSDLLDYFASIPSLPQYAASQSPVSYVMGALGQGIKSRDPLSTNFDEIYRASLLHETNNREITVINKFTKNRISKSLSTAYPATYSQQASMVLLRTQRFLWRNVQYTYGRLTGCVIIGLIMGSLYFQIVYKDVHGVTSRSLYIYMQVILIGVISANNVIPQIGTDRLVYFRERRAGMYLPIFYPLSWAVGEIPYFFIATLSLVGIGNGMAGIGIGSPSEFFKYWLVLFLFTLCVTYFGMMVTFLAPAPILAAFIVSIVTSLWVSASGVVVVLSDIKFYRWMYWSNPFQFAMNALTSISFYCDTKMCKSECNCPHLPDGSYIWNRVATSRSLNNSRIDTDILTLSGMCLLFAGLAFFYFVMLKHNTNPHA